MKRPLALLAALLLFGCGPGMTIVGNGVSRSESRDVPAFTKVSLNSGLTATVNTGMRGVTLTGDENVLPWVETYVADGTLVVQVREGVGVTAKVRLRAEVTNDVVQGLAVNGGTTAVATATPVDSFRVQAAGGSRATVSGISAHAVPVDVSGGSTVTLDGVTSSVRPTVSGGSTLMTRDLSAVDAVVTVSGASTCTLRASGVVSGEVSGASRLTVYGGGTLNVSVSGASSVDRGEQ